MIPRFFILTVLAATSLASLSCKDNPELVRQRDEQKAEIKRLEGEVAVLDETYKDIPLDRSQDLAAAKETAAAQKEEIARLEKDVADLEARKRDAEKAFADYRKKYVVKSN